MTGEPTTCNRPPCTGTIDDKGICLECWRPPLTGDEVEAGASAAAGDEGDLDATQARPAAGERWGDDQDDAPGPAAATPSPAVAPPPADGRSWVGAGIVYVPPAPEIDPGDAIIADPHIPRQSWTCGNCRAPVGYTAEGEPADEAGDCPRCDAGYDFAVKLLRGDLVAGQYEVRGVIGYGGQGWVYLAHDTHVDRRLCVLKGRRDTDNPSAAESEELERRSLAELQHPGIVEIHNFVEHTHPDRASGARKEPPPIHRYIVMAFANGWDLRRVRREQGGLRPATAVAYVHAVLPALGYLHERGFVYCDLKPENMVHSGDAVVLIDLGAAWNQKIRRAHVYSTAFYAAPEWSESGPTVATDIYAVGRTLVALLTGDPRAWPPMPGSPATGPDDPPPGPAPEPPPVLRRHDGLRRFVERACAPRPEDRFADTDETAEALLGVLCQVTAATHREPRPPTSVRWGPPRTQLEPFGWDALPPPILPAQPFDRPARSAEDLSWEDRATRAYAQCRVDDFAGAMTTVGGIDPWAGGTVALAPGVTEVPQRRTRTMSVVDTARTYLEAIVRQAEAEAAPREAEAASENDQAVDLFRAAYRAAPGELAAALALAAAIEAEVPEEPPEGDEAKAVWRVRLGEAARLYRQVAVTNPNLVGAVAGWARALRRLGRPRTAARALLRVPETHPLRLEALALACRTVPSGRYDAALAGCAGQELRRAGSRSHRRPVEEAELEAAVYRMALDAVEERPEIRDPVTGGVTSRDDLADACATALRKQAKATPSEAERHALLDEAARVQPWKKWRR